jgi:hypothetical protein
MGTLLVVAFVAGCLGQIGAGDGGDPRSGTTPADGDPSTPGGPSIAKSAFTCDESQIPAEVPLRRLSKVQYANTLRDLLRRIAPTQADAVLAAVAPQIAKLPDDLRTAKDGDTHGGFRRLDQGVQQGHVDGSYEVAIAIGKELTKDQGRLGALVGACATDADRGNDGSCLDAFVKKVAPLAHRRPIDDADVAFYRETAGADPVSAAAIADVVALMLTQPYFLYHVEHGREGGATVALSAHELANKLAYHFWQTMPDEALSAAAESGALDTDAGWNAQIARLFADPKTTDALGQFAVEWLWLDELAPLDGRKGDPVYDAFANGFVPTKELRQRMIDDVVEAFRHVVKKGGTFADFFRERGSFAATPDLAGLYGVSPWQGGEPIETGPERVGLLTRPAFLATGSANTRPIMKGYFVRKALLCDDLPPPPNNAAAMMPQLRPDMTTREVVEQLTEAPGTACAGCHTTMINPLGFATENFDALGRHRAAQSLFDETGKKVGEKAVDTSSVPRVALDDTRASTGAAELTQILVDSGRVQACFARQYFRWTFVRIEDDRRDGCALRDLAEAAKGATSIGEVLSLVAKAPAFKKRTFE